MDFIIDLPLVQEFNVVLVVVDQFSKCESFIPVSKYCSTELTMKLLFSNVFKYWEFLLALSMIETPGSSENFEVNITTTLAKDEKLHTANYEPQNEAAKQASTGKIPETGDKAHNMSKPLTVLGVGAAAVAAYSKRRCENEALSQTMSGRHARK